MPPRESVTLHDDLDDQGYLAKASLVDMYSMRLDPSPSPDYRDSMLQCAFRMLESDALLFSSPLTRRFRWFVNLHFPFVGYVHIIRDLKLRAPGNHVDRCWELLSRNYEARLGGPELDDNPLSRVLFGTILKAWTFCEVSYQRAGRVLMPVPMIIDIRARLAQDTSSDPATTSDTSEMPFGDMPPAVDFGAAPYGQGLSDPVQINFDMFDWGTLT